MKDHYDYQHIYDLCKKHMHAYVLAELSDGTSVDGIVTGLDDENVILAVPYDATNTPYQAYAGQDDRQFGNYPYGYPGYGYPGYGYPSYGFGPGYGYGYPRRRFQRLVLPLAALTALTLLPWY